MIRPVARLAVLISVIAGSTALADTVLIKGNPPLTQETVDKTIRVAEWALGIPFSPAQRKEWQTILGNYWQKEKLGEMGSVLDLAELAARVDAMSPEQRKANADKSRPALLEALRHNAPNIAEDKFLLNLYETGGDRVVVPAANGQPALTTGMLRDYAAMMETAYDVRLDDAQRQTLDRLVTDVFARHDKTNIENVVGWVAREKELRAAPVGTREAYAHYELVPSVIPQARKDAASDPEVKFLLGIHDEQHKPLVAAAGEAPALKRREAEAFLGVLFFIACKAEKFDIQPPRDVQDAWVNALAANWQNLPAENKAGFANMPELLVKLRFQWDKTDAETQKTFTDTIGNTPQGQEILARVRELKSAAAERARELDQQRERTLAAGVTRIQNLRAGISAQANATPTPIGPSHTYIPSSATDSKGGNLTEFQKASQKLAMERMKTQMISNMMEQMHQTRMMTIYNMGNGYTIERRPRY